MNQFLQTAESWSDFWIASLWRASWQGAIAVAIVWAIARWCNFLSPRVVCWLWRLACLKMLIALVWAQPLTLAVLPAAPTDLVRAKPALSLATAPVVGLEAPMLKEQNLSGTPAVPERGGIKFRSLLLLLWLAGALYCLRGIVWHWNSMRRLLSSASLASSNLLNEVCSQEASRLGMRLTPQLCLSSRVDSPLLTGVWRPTIVLPAFAQEAFDAGEVRLMLAHELAHHRRRDLLWNWLPAIVRAAFFFHPLAWLLTRRWSEAQEAACDELLIQNQVTQPMEYAKLLLKLATREPRQSPPSLAAAGVLGAYRNLERRILAMTRVKPFSFRRLSVAAVALSLLAVFSLIPWRLSAQESPPAKPSDDNSAASQKSDLPPGKIYVWADFEFKTDSSATERYRGLIRVDPNTGEWEKMGEIGQDVRLSPDGTRLKIGDYRKSDAKMWDIFIADLKNPQSAKLVENAVGGVWSPDGQKLLYRVIESTKPLRGTIWSIDLATKEKRELPIPSTDEVNDWSLQGDWLVTTSDRHSPQGRGYQLYVMHPDGTGEHRISQGKGLNVNPRFSADGKRVVYTHHPGGEDSVWTVEVDGSNPRRVLVQPHGVNTHKLDGACWSPDSRWLAILARDLGNHRVAGSSKAWLEIITADGDDRRVLKLKNVMATTFMHIPEWR